jgi:ribose 5-phosphate isomerase A
LADQEALMAQAAAHALKLVKPKMVLGLGTGRTARYFIEGVGRLVNEGLRVRVIATSNASTRLATDLGMVVESDVTGPIHLAVDGADEIDPAMRLIKGRGGALAREKLVAAAAERFVIIADGSKRVDQLGVGTLPVEVLPFFWRQTRERLAALGATCTVRGGEQATVWTDNGNMIVDLKFPEPIRDPEALAKELKQTLGVVDHGLFIGLADTCVVATAAGVNTLGEDLWKSE